MFFMLVRGCVDWRSGGVESVVERHGRFERYPDDHDQRKHATLGWRALRAVECRLEGITEGAAQDLVTGGAGFGPYDQHDTVAG